MTFLPMDSRTLLSSRRRKVDVIDIDPGKYQHFDLQAGLLQILKDMKMRNLTPDTVELIINVDGIPISKSSSSELWPILVKVNGKFLFGPSNGCQ